MSTAQVNSEIKDTKKIMDSLLICVKDKSIPVSDRNQYYKDYLEASTYYLKLNQMRPEHNLSIA